MIVCFYCWLDEMSQFACCHYIRIGGGMPWLSFPSMTRGGGSHSFCLPPYENPLLCQSSSEIVVRRLWGTCMSRLPFLGKTRSPTLPLAACWVFIKSPSNPRKDMGKFWKCFLSADWGKRVRWLRRKEQSRSINQSIHPSINLSV